MLTPIERSVPPWTHGRARVWAHRQHHLQRQGAHRHPGFVQRRSGLTGFVAGVARSPLAARGVTINNLLPGKLTPTACLHLAVSRAPAAACGGYAHTAAIRRGAWAQLGIWRDLRFCAACMQYVTGQNWLADGAPIRASIDGASSTNATTGAGGCPSNSRFSVRRALGGAALVGACSQWAGSRAAAIPVPCGGRAGRGQSVHQWEELF